MHDKRSEKYRFLYYRQTTLRKRLCAYQRMDTQKKGKKIKKANFETKAPRTTVVFAIAGQDERPIGSKSLVSSSSGLTLLIKLQMLSSAKYFQ